jgi:hypothetical protein
MVFVGRDSSYLPASKDACLRVRFRVDLDPILTGHKSGTGKPLKWFGIPMTLNPNLKVGENEMKTFEAKLIATTRYSQIVL